MSLPLDPRIIHVVTIIGALYLSTYLYDFLIGIYNHFLRPGKNIVKRYGRWAVITGGVFAFFLNFFFYPLL